MSTRKALVSFDSEGDMLEVLWEVREGFFAPTADDRILKRLDDDGEVIGFLIHEVSSFRDAMPAEIELTSESATGVTG